MATVMDSSTFLSPGNGIDSQSIVVAQIHFHSSKSNSNSFLLGF